MPLEEYGEPGLAGPLHGVSSHGRAVVAQLGNILNKLPPSDAQAVPTDEHVLDTISSSAVGVVGGPSLAASGTLPPTLLPLEVGLM